MALNPKYEYDRILDDAYKGSTTIYNNGGVIENEEIERVQSIQAAHQLRGMVIHEIIADLREYLELPTDQRQEFAASAVPFQMGLVFRVPKNAHPEWLDNIINPEEPEKSIDDLRRALIGKIGENIEIRRFARFRVGDEEA